MTGIVVVSHSAALAHAAIELAREMAGDARLVAAAGVPQGFGTDATQIAVAIESADDGMGVVVLMDLGSAVLSSEMALEFLDEDLRQRVILCPAPIVEGLVAGAVTAAGGADPTAVSNSALRALDTKLAGLEPLTATVVRTVRVRNPEGLHARPAATLVLALEGLDAEVQMRNISRDNTWVDARSMTDVMLLDARAGDQLEVQAAGPAAAEAVNRVVAIVEGQGASKDADRSE